MADDHARDELAQLRAEVAALRARVDRPRRRLPRRFLPLALAALLVALVPLATLAAAPFNDLTGGVHDGNIGLIYDAGITKGCVPNVSYCPAANVTREEMASFLARTAGLGSNPPVANAKTAQTATSAQTATNATNATNAQNAQNAVTAQTAQSAASATTAQNAVTAQTATSATSAGNANTVGGYTPSGLVRVARGGSGTTVYLTGGYVTLASATLYIPGPGFVLVTGAASLFSTSSSCGCDVSVRLRDTGPGGQASRELSAYVGVAYSAQRSESVTPTWVFPVAGAGQRTYVLEAAGASGTQSYLGEMVTALFVPFAQDGGTTLAP